MRKLLAFLVIGGIFALGCSSPTTSAKSKGPSSDTGTKMPKSEGGMPPKMDYDKPKTESDKPKTEFDKPKTESDKPKIEFDKPKTESDKPKPADSGKKDKDKDKDQ